MHNANDVHSLIQMCYKRCFFVNNHSQRHGFIPHQALFSKSLGPQMDFPSLMYKFTQFEIWLSEHGKLRYWWTTGEGRASAAVFVRGQASQKSKIYTHVRRSSSQQN